MKQYPFGGNAPPNPVRLPTRIWIFAPSLCSSEAAAEPISTYADNRFEQAFDELTSIPTKPAKMRVKQVQMTVRPLATAKQSESLWNLGGLTLAQLGRRVFDEIKANNVLGHAAELAFYFLFALFPLILIVMTSFGLFAADRIELQNDLLSYFADLLPPIAFQLLQTVFAELAAHASGGKLTLGIFSSLWAVSGGVDSMICSLNLAHHVRETRSWFKVRAITIGLSLLISILLFSALFMVLIGSRVVSWLGAALGLRPIILLAWKAIQWPGVVFVVLVSCALIYRFGPDLKQRCRWHWVSPGGAFGVFVWLSASYGFRMYVHFFNHYSAAYGSLGAVMILMLWLYVFGLAYLIGGEINAVIERTGRPAEFSECR